MRAPPPSPLSATINTKRGRWRSIWARARSTPRGAPSSPLIHPVPGDDQYDTPDASGYFQYFGAAADPAGASYYSYQLGPLAHHRAELQLLGLRLHRLHPGPGDQHRAA